MLTVALSLFSLPLYSSKKSLYTLSYRKQIMLCLGRSFQVLRADIGILVSAAIANMILSIIFASIFIGLPDSTDSFFRRDSLIFYALMLGAMTSALEVCLFLNFSQLTGAID